MQTFSDLIEQNYVYVDKTEQIYSIVTDKKYYFLARPRRFGKSLLISTLYAIFSGNKDLFKDLWIGKNAQYDWKKYPIIWLRFNGMAYETAQALKDAISWELKEIGLTYGIDLSNEPTYTEKFKKLITELAKIDQVVILIDEYDYALVNAINDLKLAQANRNVLRDFFNIVKAEDRHIRHAFITGVSKFSKTSIFSGLNNLKDLTLAHSSATLVGYTENEIKTYFPEHLKNTARRLNISTEQLINETRKWYNGYRFESGELNVPIQHVYNPFSVLLLLDESKFSNYWFETGTPTFMIDLMKSRNYEMQDFDTIEATENDLGTFDIDNIPLKTLLFQTGYLTITDYNQKTENYTLSYPNYETQKSLALRLFTTLTNKPGAQFNNVTSDLREIFEKNNLKQLHAILTDLYVMLPYTIHISEEKYYQSIFYLALKMLGANIIVERTTNIGRIDAVIQTKDSYFIIEFKINATAQQALTQIETKKYYQPYERLGKKIVLIGIAFDMKTKNVSEVKAKNFDNAPK